MMRIILTLSFVIALSTSVYASVQPKAERNIETTTNAMRFSSSTKLLSLSKPLAAEMIETKLTQELAPLGFSNIEIQFTRFPVKFDFPVTSKLLLEEMSGHRRLGIRRYKISAIGARGLRKTAFIAAAVSAEGPEVRARFQIPAGKVIAVTDLDVRMKRIIDLPQDAVTDPASIVGQEAGRTIKQNKLIEVGYVRRPFAIQRGEIIEVEADYNGFRVIVFAEALKSGYIGDRIPFKNTISMKRFFANITNTRQATVLEPVRSKKGG